MLDYIEGESLTIGFPVFRHYLTHPVRCKGEFISAAVDNVFGPLCYSATKTPQTTMIDMMTAIIVLFLKVMS